MDVVKGYWNYFSTQYGDSINAIMKAYGLIFCIVIGVICVASIVAFWIIFRKAGQHGWAAIIPIYNNIVLLRITFGSGWWILMYLIPGMAIFMNIICYAKLAEAFGHKSGAFALGINVFTLIFALIIAFTRNKYHGAPGKARPVKAPVNAAEETYNYNENGREA